jgi:hypothetical protein
MFDLKVPNTSIKKSQSQFIDNNQNIFNNKEFWNQSLSLN